MYRNIFFKTNVQEHKTQELQSVPIVFFPKTNKKRFSRVTTTISPFSTSEASYNAHP
jgi:hypothetical protein